MMHIDRKPEGQRIADIHGMIEKLCRDIELTRWWIADPEDLIKFIHDYISNPDGYCAVTIDETTGITTGCMLGFVWPLPFNHSVKIAREAFIWVEPQYRGQALGEKLVQDFSAWAKDVGATIAIIGNTNGFSGESIKKIADNLGFELQEMMYMRRV
jgi:GNAT superfamily N-acetyltransferase